MNPFAHLRHRPIGSLERERPLVVACPPLRSNVNLARIVRAAGCCGVRRVIAAGSAAVDPKIVRDSLEFLQLERRRSLPPVLQSLRKEGFRIVGLEQTTHSTNLCEYAFPRKTVLVVGNERLGLTDDLLALLDDAVEIPVFGQPDSYNVATATAMALYEYCRQYPQG